MSSVFGNRMLKQFPVVENQDSDILQEQEVDQDLELLVLASDGLWDVNLIRMPFNCQTEEETKAAARKLTESVFTCGSAEYITCIVVKFHHEIEDPE